MSGQSVDDGLRALMARGFRFQHLLDEHGNLLAIVGCCGWPELIDHILIRDEDDAKAARTTADPEDVVWSYEGDTLSAILALLDLPEPRTTH